MKIIKKDFGNFKIPNKINEFKLPFQTLIEKELEDVVKSATHIIIQGSNYGAVELLICSINPSVCIYSFEPRDTCFCILKQNLDDNQIENVIILNNALGHVCAPMNISKEQIEHIELDHVELIEIGECPLGLNTNLSFVTIDSLNLIACNLIFIDLSGFEYITLLGALRTIQKFKPVICFQNKNKTIMNIKGDINDLIQNLNYDTKSFNDYIIATCQIL